MLVLDVEGGWWTCGGGRVGRVVDVEGSWWRSGGRVDVEREWMWREGCGCGGSVDVEVG